MIIAMNTNWLSVQQINSGIWDQFVSKHPCGHPEQTSLFATMRAKNNFRFARVGIVSENGELIGGAQVLYRNIPIVGKLAFITQGPLVSQECSDIAEVLIQALDQMALKLGITRLRIINYSEDSFWAQHLSNMGFERCGSKWAPSGSVLVPCDKPDDDILASMKPKCRRNVRRAKRNDLTMKIGDQDDMGTFYELLKQTVQRKNFPIFPFDYYQRIWQLFAPNDKLHLIVTSADDEPLSAVLMSIVGNKAYYAWGGMSPNRSNLMANFMTHWEAIRLARSYGCKYYDFSGGAGDDGVSQFKRQWRGQVTDYPDPFDKYYGPLRSLRLRGTQFVWDHERLRQIVNKIDYRLHGGRMPF